MMDKSKVKRSKTSQREKCSLDRRGKPETRKFQCISVITRNPQTPIKSSSELDDDDVVIVAEYDRKTEAADVVKLAKNASIVDAEREQHPERKRRRSGGSDCGLPDTQFWYVDCGPEGGDLDSSDADSGTEYGDSDEDSEYPNPTDSEMNIGTDSERHVDSDCEETIAKAQRPRFEVLGEISYNVPGQKIWKREMGVRIRRPKPGVEAEWYDGAFRELFAHLTSSCVATDYVGFTFAIAESPHTPISLSCRSIRDYSYEDLYNLVGSAGNTSAAFKMNDTFLITTCVFRGALSRELSDPGRAILANRKSILTIRSDDQLDLPRALATARVYVERGEARSGALHELWSRVRCCTSHAQFTRARELALRAGVEVPKRSYGIGDVEKFQECLAADGVAVVVYEMASLGRGGGALYDGTGEARRAAGRVRHTLYLAYYERQRHYRPILKLQVAAGARGFCAPCNARYNNEVDHACANRCSRCFGSPPCGEPESLDCATCGLSFRGSECFERHRATWGRGESVCRTISRCEKCRVVVRRADRRRHRCGGEDYRARSRLGGENS